MLPQSNPNRDRDMTEYLYDALKRLPGEIGGLEVEAAAMTNQMRIAKGNLEDAELNATLSAPQDGKNAEARKLELQAAIAKDTNVKTYKQEVMRYEAELEMNEAEAKTKRREFQAAMALAELHAARINSMYRFQQLQQQNKGQSQ